MGGGGRGDTSGMGSGNPRKAFRWGRSEGNILRDLVSISYERYKHKFWANLTHAIRYFGISSRDYKTVAFLLKLKKDLVFYTNKNKYDATLNPGRRERRYGEKWK